MSHALRLLGLALGFLGVLVTLLGASGQPRTPEDLTPAWAIHLRTVDEALARGDVGRAVRSWHDAWVSAQESRRWEGLIEVGDAYLRIGDVARIRKASEPKARQLYLAGFFRARQAGSIDGVLRAAASFAALGDRDVAEQCLRAAERLAGEALRGPDARVRIDTARSRVADRLQRAKLAEKDPIASLPADVP